MNQVLTIRLDGAEAPVTTNANVDVSLSASFGQSPRLNRMEQIIEEHLSGSEGWAEKHKANGELWFRGQGPYQGLSREDAWALKREIGNALDASYRLSSGSGARDWHQLGSFNSDLWFNRRGPYQGLGDSDAWSLSEEIQHEVDSHAANLRRGVAPATVEASYSNNLRWVIALSDESRLWARQEGPYAGVQRDDIGLVKSQRDGAINERFGGATRSESRPVHAITEL